MPTATELPTVHRRTFITASLALPFTLASARANGLVSAMQQYKVQGDIHSIEPLLYLRAEPTHEDALRVARQEVILTENSPAQMTISGPPERVPTPPPARGVLARHVYGPAAVGDFDMHILNLLSVQGTLISTAFVTWPSMYDTSQVDAFVDHFVTWRSTLDGNYVYARSDDLTPLFPDLRPFAIKIDK